MPLKAIHRDTGEPIYIFNYRYRQEIDLQLKPLGHQGFLRCANPDCQAELFVRNGAVVTPHFAHKTKQCQSQYEHCPESLEHERGKVLVGEHIRSTFAEWANVEIEYEVPISSMKRIADTVAWFKNGILQAHEVQLASITTEKLHQRTLDYYEEGIDVQWWFGGKADTAANRQWAFETFGCVNLIENERIYTSNTYVLSEESFEHDEFENTSYHVEVKREELPL